MGLAVGQARGTTLGLGRLGIPLLAVLLIGLFALGAGTFWLVRENQAYTQAITRELRGRYVVSQTLSALQDAEVGQRGFLLTRAPSYLEPYHVARRDLPELLAELGRLLGETRTAPLVAAVELRLAIAQRTVDLAANDDVEGALAIVRTDEGRLAMEEARRLLAGFDAEQAAAFRAAEARLDLTGTLLQGLTVVATSVVLVAMLVGVGTARRHAEAEEASRRAVEAANDALEERVAERTADLAAANEEVQRFATVVTHDLRAPLVNVMGFTAELDAALPPLRDALDAAERADPALVAPAAREALERDIPEALGFIRSATARMDRLINTILKLSREGRRTLHPEPIDVEAVCRSLVRTLAHQLEQAGASIEVASPLPALTSDRAAVEQIFANLLDNAVKYLDPSRPGRIVVRGRDRGRYVVYEVADNGRGIAERDLARIFEPFRRAGPQDRPGEGIGLAHVRNMTRRLGGAIHCDSVPGEGSTFRVTLPARPVAQDSQAAARRAGTLR